MTCCTLSLFPVSTFVSEKASHLCLSEFILAHFLTTVLLRIAQ